MACVTHYQTKNGRKQSMKTKTLSWINLVIGVGFSFVAAVTFAQTRTELGANRTRCKAWRRLSEEHAEDWQSDTLRP